ncbi:MAG: isoprenylcysteine carboxylmethyltransferase family protein, partial [Anaerolineae bacterium]|nr:isoprenylcysteine carboxylmethyltransferase family protein [Anaerolineae bacterium]
LANHRLVDHGAYQVVRHPIYGFACLKSLGTVLAFPTWWNALAGGMAVTLYVLKGLEEEKLLADGLPGYRDYQRRVRYRIAPWIW